MQDMGSNPIPFIESPVRRITTKNKDCEKATVIIFKYSYITVIFM